MLAARLGTCNWSAAQVVALARGFASSPEDARHRLMGALYQLGYPQSLFLVNRACTGLKLVLNAMHKLKPTRRLVIVPAYCCPSVAATIRSVGLEPAAAPVAPNLNLDLDRLTPWLREDVLAVVGVHMYGLPLDMLKLRRDASAQGIFVIDDAAHVVGLGTPQSPLGTEGDVGLLSFNQSKTLTGGSVNGGGALLVGNEELLTDITSEYAALPEGAKRPLNFLWFAFNDAIEILPRPLTAYFGPFRPFAQFLQRWCGATSQLNEKLCAPSAIVLLSLISKLDEIVERRKRIANKYIAALSRYENLAPVQLQRDQYASRFLVRWNRGALAEPVRELLARRGVSSRLTYPRWASEGDPFNSGLDAIRATYLELPGSLRLADGLEIDRIVDALNECL